MLKIIFNYLIFPGFLFSAFLGLMTSWLDRKITARIQWRKGPVWYQNFVDILKLFYKEIIIPTQAKLSFTLSPFLGLGAVTIVATILGRLLISPNESFLGDLIVVIYLLAIPAIAFILGASSCGNPLASVGASREIKMLLGYELPFILSILVVIIKAHSIKFNEIINQQMVSGSYIFSFSGAIAFLVAFLCAQAKLGFVPFDVSEAEQEIMGGVLIEYSGLLLAIFKLMRAILFYIMPILLIVLFMGKDLTLGFLILKYLLLVILVTLFKNTNPRLRIEQVLKFFWGYLSSLGIIAIILALLGL